MFAITFTPGFFTFFAEFPKSNNMVCSHEKKERKEKFKGFKCKEGNFALNDSSLIRLLEHANECQKTRRSNIK